MSKPLLPSFLATQSILPSQTTKSFLGTWRSTISALFMLELRCSRVSSTDKKLAAIFHFLVVLSSVPVVVVVVAAVVGVYLNVITGEMATQ